MLSNDRIPVSGKGYITSSAQTEIEDQHLFGKYGAVSFRPTSCVNLIEADTDARCKKIKLHPPFIFFLI